MDMTAKLRIPGLLALMLALTPASARAIMSGEESRLAPSGDSDYAAGKAAFKAEQWQTAIADLTLVVLRRPWHDNAHTMMGYAWRKLGNYDMSLREYETALSLNPRHRGALSYLGMAYLDLGRTDDADATYRRLARVCSSLVMGFDNNGWFTGCDELTALNQAYREHGLEVPSTI